MEKFDTNLIERYFDGELDEAALSEFQQKLENDAAFAQAFELEKSIMGGLQVFGNQQLRRQLDAIHAEEAGRDNIKKLRPSRRLYMWAAAAVLAILLVAIFAIKNQKPTPEKLYAQYAVHDFGLTLQGGNDDILQKAEQYLKTGKYTDAANLLEQYIAQNPTDGQANMVLGIALLESGKYDGALQIFQNIGRNIPALQNDATWYTALTYLKKGDMANCKNELQKIPPTSARHPAATALLAKLPG